MTADHRDPANGGNGLPSIHASGGIPAGLPPDAALHRYPFATGEVLELLVVPSEPAGGGGLAVDMTTTDRASIVREWVTAASEPCPPVVVPLYDCLVILSPTHGAVVGPLHRITQLAEAVVDFASREAELRFAERRGAELLDAIEGDAEAAIDIDHVPREKRVALAGRYREAVAIGRRLSLMAPAVHAPPIHPPTLASQLGERLRDRTRLLERHELATDRAEMAERMTDSLSQRAMDTATAKQQMGLEWAIVVLLVVQTALLVVDMLAGRGTP